MLDLMLTGGIVVAVAGVLQRAARWERRHRASSVSLLQEGMGTFEGADAEAVRAEFRRSGVALPERRDPLGFA